MCTTHGHPGTWNDEALVLFDELMRGVHEGNFFQNMNFHYVNWIRTTMLLKLCTKELGSLLIMAFGLDTHCSTNEASSCL